MRPRTPEEITFNNKFLLGKFSLSGIKHNEIVFTDSPFHTPYIIDSPYDETATIYLNPRKIEHVPIQYLDNHQRLVGILWLEHRDRIQEELMQNLRNVAGICPDNTGTETFRLSGPEFYLAYDEQKKYLLLPLRVPHMLEWNHDNRPVYQLKYFSVPTIACIHELWVGLKKMLTLPSYYSIIHPFEFMDFDFETKDSRYVYAIQFHYLTR